MKQSYLQHVDERAQDNLPPLALNAEQTQSVVEHLVAGDEDDFYLDLLTHRVPPGVDEAAYVKAGFLAGIAKGEQSCQAISAEAAVRLLATMVGGYNIAPMIDLLEDETQLPEMLLEQAFVKEDIRELIRDLPEMQAAVISMRYGIGDEMLEPMSMTAIGQILNMSRDRVRTLEHKALKSLRGESEKISEYL